MYVTIALPQNLTGIWYFSNTIHLYLQAKVINWNNLKMLNVTHGYIQWIRGTWRKKKKEKKYPKLEISENSCLHKLLTLIMTMTWNSSAWRNIHPTKMFHINIIRLRSCIDNWHHLFLPAKWLQITSYKIQWM